MKPKEVAARLNENERKLLHALSGGETATTKLTGLGRDAVEKASDWAMTKGVVEFSEEVSRFTSLTDEGDVYFEKGLPEQNLRKVLVDGGMAIADLKRTFETLNIALAWIRRNGWANIDRGVISLTDKGKGIKSTPEEAALKAIKAGEPVDEDLLDQLVKRKLAIITESTTRFVNITKFGEQVLPELSELETVNIITQLTPALLSTGGWIGSRFQEYDVSLPVPNTLPGKRHFISQIIDYIRRFWVELGFKEMKGDYLELNFWNFDEGAPARRQDGGAGQADPRERMDNR